MRLLALFVALLVSFAALAQPALPVKVTQPVGITQTTPLSVTVANPVTVTQTAPLAVSVTNPVTVTQTTPLAVSVTNPVTLTQTAPLSVTVAAPVTLTQTAPLVVTNNNATPYDLPSILAREGDIITMPYSTTIAWNGVSANGGHQIGGPQPPLGKAVYVTSIDFTSDTKAKLQYGVGQLQNFGNVPTVYGSVETPVGGGTVSVNVNGWIKPGANMNGLSILKVWGKDSLAVHDFSVTLHGTQITADMNFTAAKILLWIGTSIDAGSNATDALIMYPFAMREYLADTLEYDVRLVNLSMSGSTSVQSEVYRRRGRYNIGRRLNIVVWSHGPNDGSQGIPAATVVTNMTKAIRWAKRNNPDVLFVAMAAPPNSNTTTEAAQAAIRAAQQTYINGLNDPNVRFLADTGTAWPSSLNSTMLDSDGTHPKDPGHRRLYWAFRDRFVAWLNAGLRLN